MTVRRELLRRILMFPGVMAALWGRVAAAQKRAISLDRVEKLKNVGGSVLLKIGGAPILFIRESEETIRALDPTCTHQKCTVEWNAGKKKIICPCHGSEYDTEGQVLKGPATKPLKTLEASLESGRIIFAQRDPDE